MQNTVVLLDAWNTRFYRKKGWDRGRGGSGWDEERVVEGWGIKISKIDQSYPG